MTLTLVHALVSKNGDNVIPNDKNQSSVQSSKTGKIPYLQLLHLQIQTECIMGVTSRNQKFNSYK